MTGGYQRRRGRVGVVEAGLGVELGSERVRAVWAGSDRCLALVQ